MNNETTTQIPDTSPANSPETMTVRAIHCAPWCQDGDGHAEARSVADQWCTSVSTDVMLSREEPELWSDGITRPALAGVFACRDVGEPALVSFENAPSYLTPFEARAYAKAIIHAAWVADQT